MDTHWWSVLYIQEEPSNPCAYGACGHPLLVTNCMEIPIGCSLDYLQHRETERMREHVRFPRHCLHAETIRFPHPDGGFKKIKAPLPFDMQSDCGWFHLFG